MLIWGSLGIFAVKLGWPPPLVASIRAITGAVFAAALVRNAGIKPDWQEIRRRLPYLAAAGAFIGTNWILLFYGYMYRQIYQFQIHLM